MSSFTVRESTRPQQRSWRRPRRNTLAYAVVFIVFVRLKVIATLFSTRSFFGLQKRLDLFDALRYAFGALVDALQISFVFLFESTQLYFEVGAVNLVKEILTECEANVVVAGH